MAGVTLPAARLTLEESVALDTHEYTIERGLRTFYAVGNALAAIRDQRLYRATHFTFEQYCEARWNIKQSRAYQLMDAASVVENLRSSTMVELPQNERQARALAQLAPERQPEAWEQIVETAPNGKVTAAHAERVVEQMQILPSMPPANVLLSSSSEEWYTPPHILDRVVAFFGEIDLDPCSNSKTSPNVPASSHYTKADDGLVQSWRGRVYMNPPYGLGIGLWVQKLLAAYEHGTIEAGVALVPARTDTAWFWPFWRFPLCFVRGRLHFGSPEGKDNSATFPSVIACISTDRETFAACFGELGYIVNEHRETHG